MDDPLFNILSILNGGVSKNANALIAFPVAISGTVVGEIPDCLLLSGTVVGENPDHVCWVVIHQCLISTIALLGIPTLIFEKEGMHTLPCLT